MYLGESLKFCAKALAEALLELEYISDSTPVPAEYEPLKQDLEGWCSAIKKDIECLARLLKELDSQILQLRTMVRSMPYILLLNLKNSDISIDQRAA
jgi:hypothetical protein